MFKEFDIQAEIEFYLRQLSQPETPVTYLNVKQFVHRTYIMFAFSFSPRKVITPAAHVLLIIFQEQNWDVCVWIFFLI